MLYRNACIESFLYAPVVNGARIWFVSSHYQIISSAKSRNNSGKGKDGVRSFSADLPREAPMVREIGKP